jgi:thioredoxin-like negative regulator of GroEL
MDAEEYRKKLELDILKIIEEKLQKGQMDLTRAQLIARMLLDKLHPPLTLEQIYKIAPTLDDHFTELSTAVLSLTEEHDEKIKNVVIEHAEKMIRSGRFDEAESLLKQALTKQEEDKNG